MPASTESPFQMPYYYETLSHIEAQTYHKIETTLSLSLINKIAQNLPIKTLSYHQLAFNLFPIQ